MVREDYPLTSLYSFIACAILETLGGIKDSEVKAKARRISIQARVYGISVSEKHDTCYVKVVGALTDDHIVPEGVSTITVDISADDGGEIVL